MHDDPDPDRVAVRPARAGRPDGEAGDQLRGGAWSGRPPHAIAHLASQRQAS
jgi:hypothetical protein